MAKTAKSQRSHRAASLGRCAWQHSAKEAKSWSPWRFSTGEWWNPRCANYSDFLTWLQEHVAKAPGLQIHEIVGFLQGHLSNFKSEIQSISGQSCSPVRHLEPLRRQVFQGIALSPVPFSMCHIKRLTRWSTWVEMLKGQLWRTTVSELPRVTQTTETNNKSRSLRKESTALSNWKRCFWHKKPSRSCNILQDAVDVWSLGSRMTLHPILNKNLDCGNGWENGSNLASLHGTTRASSIAGSFRI